VVDVKALVLDQPALDLAGDMGGAVVHDDVDLQASWHLASTSSRNEQKLVESLASMVVAWKMPPPWTSRAARRLAMPRRTYSCSWRSAWPGSSGTVGWV